MSDDKRFDGTFSVPRAEHHQKWQSGQLGFDGVVLSPKVDDEPVFDLLWHPRPPWYRPFSRRQWDRELRHRRDLMRIVGKDARFW